MASDHLVPSLTRGFWTQTGIDIHMLLSGIYSHFFLGDHMDHVFMSEILNQEQICHPVDIYLVMSGDILKFLYMDGGGVLLVSGG